MPNQYDITMAKLRRFYRSVGMGATVEEAREQEGMTGRTLYQWVEKSRCGQAPRWIYQRHLTHFGRTCDLCGRVALCNEMVCRDELFEGIKMPMRFCRDTRCDRLWDEQEAQCRVSMDHLRVYLREADLREM